MDKRKIKVIVYNIWPLLISLLTVIYIYEPELFMAV